jgi:hypothetical protein
MLTAGPHQLGYEIFSTGGVKRDAKGVCIELKYLSPNGQDVSALIVEAN